MASVLCTVINNCHSNSLIPLINKPTRNANNNPSILDQCFSNYLKRRTGSFIRCARDWQVKQAGLLLLFFLFSGKYPCTGKRWYTYCNSYAYHTLNSTVLDHIWTNQLYDTFNGIFILDITDHYPIFTIAPINCPQK